MQDYKKPILLVVEAEGAREIYRVLEKLISHTDCFDCLESDEYILLNNFAQALDLKLNMVGYG